MSGTSLYFQSNFNRVVPNSKTSENLSISAYKKDLTIVLGKLKFLQKTLEMLESTRDELSEDAWSTQLCILENERKEITNIIQKFKSKSTVDALKKMLKKRARKRAYICRRNIQLKADKRERIKIRQQLEKSTDEWYKKEVSKSLEIKQTEEASAKSNIVLYAVNKKISEAEQFICLFEKLENLRKYRNLANAGRNYPDNEFLVKINRLKCVWKDALTEYEAEKRKLQLLLRNSIKSIEHQWKEMLFGEDFQNESINTEAKSLHQFIDIRRAWDSYIIPEDSLGGTSIPLGWVMPNENPCKQWDLYRSTE